MRADHAAQGADFPRRAHAHFDHGKPGVDRHPREGQWNAEVVIEVAPGGEGRTQRRKSCGCQFLCAGFADRAGNPEHEGIFCGGAAVSAHGVQRCGGVLHDDLRRAQVQRTLDQQRSGASLHGCAGEIVGVIIGASQRDEQVAGYKGTGVDGDAGDRGCGVARGIAVQGALGGSGNVFHGPEAHDLWPPSSGWPQTATAARCVCSAS